MPIAKALVVAALTLLIGAAPAAGAETLTTARGKQLSSDDLREVFAGGRWRGTNFRGKETVVAYGADGIKAGANPDGTDIGRWWAADGKLCGQWKRWRKGKSTCRIVIADGTTFSAFKGDGTLVFKGTFWRPRDAESENEIVRLRKEVERLGKAPTRGSNHKEMAQVCHYRSQQSAGRQAGCSELFEAEERLRTTLLREQPTGVAVLVARTDRAASEGSTALEREREESQRLRRELEETRRLQAEAEARAKTPSAPTRTQQGNLPANAMDTTLPVIRAGVPERVVVGDRVRLAGLVGDDGSPPRLKVNGRPVTLFRPRAGDEVLARNTLAFRVDIDTARPGPQAYILEACDAAGNCIGQELSLTVVAANRPNIDSSNFALVVGNNDYQRLPGLRTAVADASAVADVLKSRYAFRDEDVRLLLNADRRTILGALEGLRKELGTDDRLFIYYAGHGQIDLATDEGFWQPVDADPELQFTWIANDDVRRYIRGMPAKHVLVVADSCFSGSLTRGVEPRGEISKDRFYTEIDMPVSRKIISSGGTEPVADSGSGGHSVFAYYLLKALRENDSPYLASFELFNKIARAVTNNSNQKPQFGTVLEAGDEGFGDFTFILKN